MVSATIDRMGWLVAGAESHRERDVRVFDAVGRFWSVTACLCGFDRARVCVPDDVVSERGRAGYFLALLLSGTVLSTRAKTSRLGSIAEIQTDPLPFHRKS